HNTYFTLPVLVAMLSNHYGFLYGARNNWLVLVLVMGAGALIRHSFVARHQARVRGRRVPWEYAGGGVAALLVVVASLAPASQPATLATAAAPAVRFAEVSAVVTQRCVMCHNEQLASKNMQLHTPAL